jgi:hypothetical protein
MDIPVRAHVQCADGPCGKTAYIIIDPTKEEVTHVVVEIGAFPISQRIVAVGEIDRATPDMIHLKCTRDQLDAMEHFVDTEFVPGFASFIGYAPGQYWLSPYVGPGAFVVKQEREHIPLGALAVKRGALVCATDGIVGHVDEFLIDPLDRHITHLVLREWHLWGQKDVSIPVSQIDHIEDAAVHVKLARSDIETLPHIPIKRHPAATPEPPGAN